MSADGLTDPLGPVCRDRQRYADIRQSPESNGIDFVEYERRPGEAGSSDRHLLLVHFINPLLPARHDPFAMPDFGLPEHPEWVHLLGGTRIVGIRVLEVQRVEEHLEIRVDRAGDFSTYWLLLGWRRDADGIWRQTVRGLDPHYSRAPLSFKAACPVDFDCREETPCAAGSVPEPFIDYLAKDYGSFRRLMLDAIPRLNPDWLERNPADLGIALVELLAYEGDHLSYFQDAVANEAYLDTARQRVSAKRHARLLDYRMHDGRNAWTFVHFAVNSQGKLPAGTRLMTRISAPLMGKAAPPDTEIAPEDCPDNRFDQDPALAGVEIFETAHAAAVNPRNNLILLHTWGNLECCLPRGSTQADLYVIDPNDSGQADRPWLNPRGHLLLEEVKGPLTGLSADADPAHRQVVRVTRYEKLEDPLYARELQDGEPRVRREREKALPLLRVYWEREDALRFPLCLSAKPDRGASIRQVSVARGNLVAADHGRTVREALSLGGNPPRAVLAAGPLTMQWPPPESAAYEVDAGGWAEPALSVFRPQLGGPAQDAVPAVILAIEDGAGVEVWEPVPDLLDSTPDSRHFVADLDHRGRATLRFGDGVYGRCPGGSASVRATYRVGNGRAGNIGAESLVHVMQPLYTPPEIAGRWPEIGRVRNPLAAVDGTDPETIEQVRQLAPAAFHAEQLRAVTEADYAGAARKMPGVAGAVAAFRWTGSWFTVCVAVDPLDPADLVTEPGGRTRLAPVFEQRVRAFLTRYRLAGYDLQVRSAEYVPLEIDLDLCVQPGHFRADVALAARRALGNGIGADGRAGLFHPDNLSFGQPVYLSRVYAAVESVEGVESVTATRFRRFGAMDDKVPEDGVIPIGPWEIARLDNDPNFMENGVLRICAGGGK